MLNLELVRDDDVSSVRRIAIGEVRARKDEALERTRKTLLGIPSLLLAPVLQLMSFGHRLIDGLHASVPSRVLIQWIERPFDHVD